MTDKEVLNKLELLIESFDLTNWELASLIVEPYSESIKYELWRMMNDRWIRSDGLNYSHLLLSNNFKTSISKSNV